MIESRLSSPSPDLLLFCTLTGKVSCEQQIIALVYVCTTIACRLPKRNPPGNNTQNRGAPEGDVPLPTSNTVPCAIFPAIKLASQVPFSRASALRPFLKKGQDSR